MKYFLKLFTVILIYTNINAQQPDPLVSSNYLLQKKWVDSIYNSITLKEKIGQLFIPMVFSNKDSTHLNNTIDLIKLNNIGGLIFSKGSVSSQISWSNIFQSNSKIC